MPIKETNKAVKKPIVKISCSPGTLSSEQLKNLASFRNMRGNIQRKKRI